MEISKRRERVEKLKIEESVEMKEEIICGLANLGNTCFMNSGLQCLMSNSHLSKYLMSNQFVKDLNVDNVLGCNGQLATAYASLLKAMSRSTLLSPFQFRNTLLHYAVQFQGYNQHDAMEFVNYLLDSLHEDLNKVHIKPYIQE